MKLPRVTAAELITVIEKIGFPLSRQSGSHKIFKNSESKRITIPYHTGKTLHPKILSSILKDTGLTIERFYELKSGKK